MTSNYTMNALEWSMLILLSVLWGTSFFFIEIALRELGPLTLVFFRIGVAALVIVIYIYLSGNRLPGDRQSWLMFFKLGAFNNVLPFTLISWGQVHIDSGLTSILNAMTPLFAVILAHFLTHDERMTRNRVIGVLLGIIGVGLLIGPDAIHGFSFHAIGQLAVLAAGVSYAYGGIYARQFRNMSGMVAVSGTLIAATVMILPFVIIFEPPLRMTYQLSTIGAILGISLLGTAVAYILYFRIIRTAGATNTLLVTFLVPVTALLLGVFILGETLGGYAILGMIVIFAGLLSVDGRIIRLVHLPK